jgi:hypothetical protein
MSARESNRRMSYLVLCASLVLVSVLFAIRAEYVPATYWAIAIAQIIAIGVSAWRVGAWAIGPPPDARRRLALAGALLVAPFALFSFLPGFSRPDLATPRENHLRYVILFINPILLAGGLILLKEALDQAEERVFPTLGFAAIVFATPLQLVFAAIAIGAYSHAADTRSSIGPIWSLWTSNLPDVLLYFGGALTYLSTAAFAAALGRAGWLGRRATLAFEVASLAAVLMLVVRGLDFPDPKLIFSHPYMIPGYIVGIPAVPWIMPLMLGVVLLRRAGRAASPPSGST